MKTKIPDYSNTGFAANIRHWLIKKVAGKHAVVMNVRIDIVPRSDHPGFLGSIKNINGGLIDSVVFPDYGDTIIQLTGAPKP